MAKVLVVDDSGQWREILRNWLEKDGFEVIENDSGRGVLAQIEAEKPVCVFLDIIMPDMDGFEVLRKMFDVIDKPPIIAMSVQSIYVELANEFQGVDCLNKPFGYKDVHELLVNLNLITS